MGQRPVLSRLLREGQAIERTHCRGHCRGQSQQLKICGKVDNRKAESLNLRSRGDALKNSPCLMFARQRPACSSAHTLCSRFSNPVYPVQPCSSLNWEMNMDGQDIQDCFGTSTTRACSRSFLETCPENLASILKWHPYSFACEYV